MECGLHAGLEALGHGLHDPQLSVIERPAGGVAKLVVVREGVARALEDLRHLLRHYAASDALLDGGSEAGDLFGRDAAAIDDHGALGHRNQSRERLRRVVTVAHVELAIRLILRRMKLGEAANGASLLPAKRAGAKSRRRTLDQLLAKGRSTMPVNARDSKVTRIQSALEELIFGGHTSRSDDIRLRRAAETFLTVIEEVVADTSGKSS